MSREFGRLGPKALGSFEENKNTPRKHPRKSGQKTKMVLLGVEHSGKTTFFKQIQSHYTPEKFQKFIESRGRARAIRTLIENTQTILEMAQTNLITTEAKKAAEFIFDTWKPYNLLTECEKFEESSAEALSHLWSDPEFLKVYENSMFLQNAEFSNFVVNCDDLASKDVEVPEELHLMLHYPTMTFNRTKFVMNEQISPRDDLKLMSREKEPKGGKNEVQLWDVSSVHSTRRDRWKTPLQKSNVVVYFCSLADYCTNAVQGLKRNLLQDSLEMFRFVCDNLQAKQNDVIVVLSKIDIFVRRLREMRIPLNHSGLFPNCPSGELAFDVDANIDFIKDLFIQQIGHKNVKLRAENIHFEVINLFEKEAVQKFFDVCVNAMDSEKSFKNAFNNHPSNIVKTQTIGRRELRQQNPAISNLMRNNHMRRSSSFSILSTQPQRSSSSFNQVAQIGSLMNADEEKPGETRNIWQKMVVSFASNFNRLTPKGAGDLEKAVFNYKAGTYVVIRLHQAISAIFKPHPFRSRGSMFISALAASFSATLNKVLNGMIKEKQNQPILTRLLHRKQIRKRGGSDVGKSRLNRQASGAFSVASLASYATFSTWQSGSVFARAESKNSIASYHTEAQESIQSALSVFAASVQETEEKSLRSDSLASMSDKDSFAGEDEFTNIMNAVLEENQFVESEDDPQETLRSLIGILDRIRDDSRWLVNRTWTRDVFHVRSTVHAQHKAVQFVQRILAMLHKVNRDICGSTRNHFQHSRLVNDLTKIKARNPLTEELFGSWIKSRNELDAETQQQFHPVMLLREHLKLHYMDNNKFNAMEKDALSKYLIRKMAEARRLNP